MSDLTLDLIQQSFDKLLSLSNVYSDQAKLYNDLSSIQNKILLGIGASVQEKSNNYIVVDSKFPLYAEVVEYLEERLKLSLNITFETTNLENSDSLIYLTYINRDTNKILLSQKLDALHSNYTNKQIKAFVLVDKDYKTEELLKLAGCIYIQESGKDMNGKVTFKDFVEEKTKVSVKDLVKFEKKGVTISQKSIFNIQNATNLIGRDKLSELNEKHRKERAAYIEDFPKYASIWIGQQSERDAQLGSIIDGILKELGSNLQEYGNSIAIHSHDPKFQEQFYMNQNLIMSPQGGKPKPKKDIIENMQFRNKMFEEFLANITDYTSKVADPTMIIPLFDTISADKSFLIYGCSEADFVASVTLYANDPELAAAFGKLQDTVSKMSLYFPGY